MKKNRSSLLTILFLFCGIILLHIGNATRTTGDFSLESIGASARYLISPEKAKPPEVNEDELYADSIYRYYYTTLPDDQKELYLQLYVAVRDQLEKTPVSADDSDTLSHVMNLMLLDNPQLYYIDNWSIETQTNLSSTQIFLLPNFNMNSAELQKASSAITAFTNSCLAGLGSDMTDYEKALYLFRYVVEHTDYELNSPYNQNMYSVVLGKSVCKGYACTYKYLCDQVGIPCINVTGTMDEAHAWNIVKIDGEWCHVDCTSGDDITSPAAMTDYSWFGLNDEMILKNHTIDLAEILPACTATTNNYYIRNNLYFEKFELDVLKAQFAGGRNFSFQCASTEAYNQACTVLAKSSELSRYLGSIGLTNVSYLPNDSTNTLFIFLEY